MRLPRFLLALSIIASLPLAACGTVDPYGYNYGGGYSTTTPTYNRPTQRDWFPTASSCAVSRPRDLRSTETWTCVPVDMYGGHVGTRVDNYVGGYGYDRGYYPGDRDAYRYGRRGSGNGVAVGLIAGAAIACAIACNGGGNHGHRGGHRGH